MSVKSETGYLVLGDITGYTSYVATTELEHSQEILSELLQLIIENFQKLLTIVKVEGDAIFACTEKSAVPKGENILDLVESTYFNFRKRVQIIEQQTTCDCNACRAIPNLDLKFFVHYGEYIAQTFGNIRDLVGTDVNLIHRLMKNQISDLTGWTAYALFTEKSINEIDIPDDILFKHEETVEHFGSVKTFSMDLHKYFEVIQKKNSVRITSETADKSFSYYFDFPPITVWDWITDPTYRNIEDTQNIWSPIIRPNGRTGVGATNHCVHGKGELSGETILDWHPFEYFSVEINAEINKQSPIDATITYELVAADDNSKTTLNLYYEFLNKSDTNVIEEQFPFIQKGLTQLFDITSKQAKNSLK